MWGIHQWPVNSRHKGQVTRKMFPFDDVIMWFICSWCPIKDQRLSEGQRSSRRLDQRQQNLCETWTSFGKSIRFDTSGGRLERGLPVSSVGEGWDISQNIVNYLKKWRKQKSIKSIDSQRKMEVIVCLLMLQHHWALGYLQIQWWAGPGPVIIRHRYLKGWNMEQSW